MRLAEQARVATKEELRGMKGACPCGQTFLTGDVVRELGRHVAQRHPEARRAEDGSVIMPYCPTMREAWDAVKAGFPVLIPAEAPKG